MLSAIKRITHHPGTRFVTPILDSWQNEVIVVHNDIPYKFHIRADPGWYVLLLNGDIARSANPVEIVEYMSNLKSRTVICAAMVSETTALCVPFNAERKELEPIAVNLVRGSVEQGDILTVRRLAGELIFDCVCERIFRRTVNTKEMAAAMSVKVSKQETDVDKITHSLGLAGAELVDWSEKGNGYLVTWLYDGYTHTANVSRNMMLKSVGICLNGTDKLHSLSMAVRIIQQARAEHRFDMPRNSWI